MTLETAIRELIANADESVTDGELLDMIMEELDKMHDGQECISAFRSDKTAEQQLVEKVNQLERRIRVLERLNNPPYPPSPSTSDERWRELMREAARNDPFTLRTAIP
jgi:hypothetical protein